MYNILIADDEYEIRTGLANYFPWEDLGFEVIGQCENGKQVLDFLSHNLVHVLLCDIRMPVLNGLEVAKILHSQHSPIRLVFLSGYKDFEYVREALICGACNYILKPTKYRELTSVFQDIKRDLDKEYDPLISAAEQDSDVTIYRIKSIIKGNYSSVTLESVADSICLSPTYVSKLFKQKTGSNFYDYVTACRMRKAAEMLHEGIYKTYEISEQVGYTNPKNFSRAFKKYYGVSPLEYKSNSARRINHNDI